MSDRNYSLDLIPIRIDIESEGYPSRYRDAILWKIQEDISPEYFAELTCHDEQLPLNIFKQPIVSIIQEYIQDFYYYKDSIQSMIPFFKTLSFIVRMDIAMDSVHLVDRFQWPLYPDNDYKISDLSILPEYQLSDKMVNELGLPSSFRSMISFSIIEQMYWIRKTLVMHQSTIPIELQDIIITHVNSNNSRFRPLDSLSMFAPRVTLLTDHDMDQLDTTRERETRRAKRQIVKQKQYRSNEVFWSPPSFDLEQCPRLIFRKSHMEPQTPSISDSPIRKRTFDTPYQCSKCNKTFYIDQPSSQMGFICTSCRSKNIRNAMEITDSVQDSDDESLDPNINPREGINAEPLTSEQKQYIPDWMDEVLNKLLEKHPKDFFYLVVDGKEVKVKCYDCDRVYMPGPNRTLSNFEVHLRNKQHCKLVRDRILSIKKKHE